MSEPAIQIKHLSKEFSIGLRGVRVRAVDDLSLEVPDGQIFGLLGPNGSGKSTTIKTILGLLEPTGGSCRIYGKSSGTAVARRDVGYLPEAPYFYRFLSGRELVRFFAKISGLRGAEMKARVDEVIELVGLKDAGHRRVATYSKGMLQRIGLAQALVHDPRLIILDEPTAGVDPIGAADIARIIHQLRERGKTVLLCSHLLTQVEDLCDEVAILSRGRLALKGGVEELLKRPGSASLVLEETEGGRIEEARQALEAKGIKVSGVRQPRRTLEELFLEKVVAGDIEEARKAEPAENGENPRKD